MPNPRGRPCKLTPEIQDKIVLAITAGNYMETAAAFSGISKDTLYNWLKEGARHPKSPFGAFAAAVAQAQAVAEVRDVQRIDAAAKTEWQAAAWRLERKHSDRWGRRKVFQGAAAFDDLSEIAVPRPGESPVATQLRVAEACVASCAARGDMQGVQFWQEQLRKFALAQAHLNGNGGPGTGAGAMHLEVNNRMPGVDDDDGCGPN